MATTNISVTTAWVKVANATEAFLISSNVRCLIQFAATTADSAPTVEGHALLLGNAGEALTRDAIGPGYVWARTAGNWPGAVLVVSK